MRDFTVDASDIYFSEVQTPIGTIQRVPVGGGTPTPIVSNVIAWVLIGDANRVYWIDAASNTIAETRKAAGSGTNSVLVLPVKLASDPMLAAEGLAVGPGGLYATSTQSGDIVWLF